MSSAWPCPACGFDRFKAEQCGLRPHDCPCIATVDIYHAQARTGTTSIYDAELLAYANPALYAPHTPAGA